MSHVCHSLPTHLQEDILVAAKFSGDYEWIMDICVQGYLFDQSKFQLIGQMLGEYNF